MSRDTSWSGQRVAFPRRVRDQILERDGHQCVALLDDGTRCPTTEGLQADHIVNDAEAKRMGWTESMIHDPSNGQTLCKPHHDEKTRDEIARGRARKSRRRPQRERHPGLVDPDDRPRSA